MAAAVRSLPHDRHVPRRVPLRAAAGRARRERASGQARDHRPDVRADAGTDRHPDGRVVDQRVRRAQPRRLVRDRRGGRAADDDGADRGVLPDAVCAGVRPTRHRLRARPGHPLVRARQPARRPPDQALSAQPPGRRRDSGPVGRHRKRGHAVTTSPTSTVDIVRKLIDQQLNLSGHGFELKHDDNLWDMGMTSLTCLGLMLSIEDTFGVELPEDALKESTFRSVDTITAAVDGVLSSAQS
ncbi:hypothetical protein EAO75_05680 [Streptomyces sp. uw30]|nr:hypothetical protein EAO75_05680 [Streptomyces sp. uw30]